MAIDLDFGGTKAASGFAPIPEGTYDARVDEIEVKETKDKDGEKQVTSDGQQARYLNVKYKIMGGDYDGRFVWGINSIRFPASPVDDTEKERQTREIFLSWLNTVSGTNFEDSKQSLDLNNLVGSNVKLVVIQDEYQGNINNKVKRVMEPGDGDTLDAIRRTL